MIEVKKTTYKVDGCVEPCFEVSDGYTLVRLAPLYHYCEKTTTLITEYVDGEFNSSEEWSVEFDSLCESQAVDVAHRYSAYLLL